MVSRATPGPAKAAEDSSASIRTHGRVVLLAKLSMMKKKSQRSSRAANAGLAWKVLWG